MRQVMGLMTDVSPSRFTVDGLTAVLAAIRAEDGVPGDAELNIWFDPDTRREGYPVGPMWRIRARWEVA